ncbi:hypothetical protein CGZ93_09920 [Enemella dayhoffiae]|uniref:Antitoxin FitA-like ribbon-helix-helix domain-containing protein n=1 Tax=Enemella dayhoffiae TaxID=2016507 RepID=A0A255H3G3_9ACTN|nr:hypothetical protein [Enemella dayhoffiae]OYO21613.1 hypothetical protein CGZ93_09920 [Enemella dayhoffiae]
MKQTADELVAAIRSHSELPARDETVRTQQEYFYPSTWRAHWPQCLPVPPTLADVQPGTHKKRTVTREDIFTRANSVETELDALDLYVLMCGWGAGWQGLTGWRSRRPLAMPGVASALLRSHSEIRNGADPVKAYQRLLNGENRIKYFGPAFFTKWLYFSGYESAPASGLRPLILDSRVAATLGWPSYGWASEQYGQYLRLAHEAAVRLDSTPHAVEHALYILRGNQVVGADEPDSTTITIPDLPDHVLAALRQLADSRGQVLEELVQDLLAEAVHRPLDDPEDGHRGTPAPGSSDT